MIVPGRKFVWAVRTGGRYGNVEIFANKPTFHKNRFLSEWRDRTAGAYYHGYSLFGFCPREFNKIAKLPIGRPVKLSIKVTLK